MKWNKLLIVAVCVCNPCLEWTRFSGVVKAVNLKAASVTIQNTDGDLLTIPIDYQVRIGGKKGETRTLKELQLDDKVTLIRIPADKPVEETEGLVPVQRGE